MEFKEFNKIPRLKREIVITEKINCPDPEEVRADIRMAAVQARLNARGILDLKFCKDADKWNALTREQRIHELCDVLEQWLDGKCVPMKPVGDSVRSPPSAERKHVINHAGDCEPYCWCKISHGAEVHCD